MRVPWRRRRNLAERLRPYVRSLPLSEPMVSADPIRMFLYRWMIETGDPIETVAKGFDLDPRLIWQLIEGEIHLISEAHRNELQAKLYWFEEVATTASEEVRWRTPSEPRHRNG